MTRSYHSGRFRCLLAIVWVGCAWAGVAHSEDAEPRPTAETNETPPASAAAGDTDKDLSMSLTHAAPGLIPSLRLHPDYFGSPWQKEGGPLERSALSGDWGGARTSLVENGLFLDVSVTQVYQGNLAGGRSTDEGMRYVGSVDYWLSLDTAKAGLWPGGLLMVHGETRFGRGANLNVGSIVPTNFDGLFPSPAGGPHDTGLPEVYLMQALSEQLTLVMGKLNAVGLVDQNAFANQSRTQFLNTALNNNPMLFAFAGYAPLAVAAVVTLSPEHSITFAVNDTEGRANGAGWDTAFDRAVTAAAEWAVKPRLGGQPGTYRLGYLWSDRVMRSYAVDRRTFIGQLAGLVPPSTEGENYVVYANFDQYLVTLDEKQGRGWGLFGRFGVAPEDRNAISQFYSFGVGGKGIIASRPDDRFGVGWYYARFSDDLKNNLRVLRRGLRNEQGVEAFYNIQVTPAVAVTPTLQVIIDPAARGPNPASDDYALVFGVRLQMDF